MFSKLNQEFASHQKGFQILLGLVIIVPFVMMIPGIDPFGFSGPSKPDTVGKIAGEEVSWETYEKEARNLLAYFAIHGNVQVLANANSIINDEQFPEDVLKFMADKKIVEDQKSKGFDPGEIKPEDIKKFTSKIEAQMSRRFPGFKVSDQIESIRVRLRIGGAEIDQIIKDAIHRERLEEYLKDQVKIPEDVVIAETKKQEKTYKFREASFPAKDFEDEPLKEYYEKNKEKYFRKDAIKASVVVVESNEFKAEYDKLDLKEEKEKFINEAVKKSTAGNDNVIEALKKEAAQDFEVEKLEELAAKKAEMIKESFLRSVKGSKDTEAFEKAITSVAKAAGYEVQKSVYVDPSDLENKKYFMNDEALTKAILGLTPENPVALHKGFRASYVVVLNDKGTHAEFPTVRNEILKEVYDADSNNYYLTNKENFKKNHTMRIGLAEFTTSMFNAETKVTEEEIKKAYENEPTYHQPQRELIQFSVEVKAGATDEEKKKLEEKLTAFVGKNKGLQPAGIKGLIVNAQNGIKKDTIGWKVQNSLEIGTNKEFMDAAFATEVGQFTKLLKTDQMMAVIYVTDKRDKTPLDEVKAVIQSKLVAEKSKDIAKEKAQEFHQMLKDVNPRTIENINKAIEEYGKSNQIQIRYLDDIMPLDAGMDPRFAQFLAGRHNITPDLYIQAGTLTKNRPFSSVRTVPPSYHKAVVFINKDIPEHYESYEEEEVKQRIYRVLNSNKAKELASAHAEKVAMEVEKAVEDKKKLEELLKTYKFQEAKAVKYKNTANAVKAILKDSPQAGFVGSESTNEGLNNTVVYVESVMEATEEEIAKAKSDHQKRLKTEQEREKLEKFWETERKKFEVTGTKTATAAES